MSKGDGKRKLTKQVVQSLQAAEKDIVVHDAEIPGFGVKVTPKGKKVFFYRYRLGGAGSKERKLTIGTFGLVTAEQARDKAKQAAASVQLGGDPVGDQIAKSESAAKAKSVRTLEATLEEYLHSKRDRKSINEVARLLKNDIVPELGDQALAEISSEDLRTIFNQVRERAPGTAANLFAETRGLFSWCLKRGYIEQSPLIKVDKPSSPGARERYLSEREVPAFWRMTERLGSPFGSLLQLLLLTGQRRSEVGEMQWSELNMADRIWHLSGERVKNGKSHDVFLSDQACKIILAQPTQGTKFVFTTNMVSPVSGFSKVANRALQMFREELAMDTLQVAYLPWRWHDLRRTHATLLQSLGFSLDLIERILNHRSGSVGGVVGVYQKHEFKKERAEAAQKLAEHVRDLMEATICAQSQ